MDVAPSRLVWQSLQNRSVGGTAAYFVFLALVLSILFAPQAKAQVQENVSIVDKGTHFDITLDFERGATHRQIGEEFGGKIRTKIPNFEANLDSYIAENIGSWIIYKIMIRRVNQIKKQIPKDYRDEIEGIASRLSGGSTFGDGKINLNELYMFNLLGDIARLYKCSAVGVFGECSATGSTILARNFDWPDGKKNQLTQLQCVTTIKNHEKSTVNVACVAFQGAVSAFNTHGVFASVLDSPTGSKYTAKHKHSYLFDLRQALEENTTLEGVSNYMKDPARPFAYNHNILLGDRNMAAVLENNIDKAADGTSRRQLRTADSQLHANVTWDVPNAVGSVNCFRLKECLDNHLEPSDVKEAAKRSKKASVTPSDVNSGRWESLRSQLKLLGPKISADSMKKTLSFYHPESRGNIYKGDLYNSYTMESIVFQPASFSLSVAFRPRNGKLPPSLLFEEIPVKITPKAAAY